MVNYSEEKKGIRIETPRYIFLLSFSWPFISKQRSRWEDLASSRKDQGQVEGLSKNVTVETFSRELLSLFLAFLPLTRLVFLRNLRGFENGQLVITPSNVKGCEKKREREKEGNHKSLGREREGEEVVLVKDET